MRILVKLLAAPVVLVLMLFVWVCSALLYCSAFVFGLAGTIIGLLGLAVLATYSVKNGIILLVIAFLVSPWGCLWRRHGCWEKSRICGMRFRTGFMDDDPIRM